MTVRAKMGVIGSESGIKQFGVPLQEASWICDIPAKTPRSQGAFQFGPATTHAALVDPLGDKGLISFTGDDSLFPLGIDLMLVFPPPRALQENLLDESIDHSLSVCAGILVPQVLVVCESQKQLDSLRQRHVTSTCPEMAEYIQGHVFYLVWPKVESATRGELTVPADIFKAASSSTTTATSSPVPVVSLPDGLVVLFMQARRYPLLCAETWATKQAARTGTIRVRLDSLLGPSTPGERFLWVDWSYSSRVEAAVVVAFPLTLDTFALEKNFSSALKVSMPTSEEFCIPPALAMVCVGREGSLVQMELQGYHPGAKKVSALGLSNSQSERHFEKVEGTVILGQPPHAASGANMFPAFGKSNRWYNNPLRIANGWALPPSRAAELVTPEPGNPPKTISVVFPCTCGGAPPAFAMNEVTKKTFTKWAPLAPEPLCRCQGDILDFLLIRCQWQFYDMPRAEIIGLGGSSTFVAHVISIQFDAQVGATLKCKSAQSSGGNHQDDFSMVAWSPASPTPSPFRAPVCSRVLLRSDKSKKTICFSGYVSGIHCNPGRVPCPSRRKFLNETLLKNKKKTGTVTSTVPPLESFSTRVQRKISLHYNLKFGCDVWRVKFPTHPIPRAEKNFVEGTALNEAEALLFSLAVQGLAKTTGGVGRDVAFAVAFGRLVHLPFTTAANDSPLKVLVSPLDATGAHSLCRHPTSTDRKEVAVCCDHPMPGDRGDVHFQKLSVYYAAVQGNFRLVEEHLLFGVPKFYRSFMRQCFQTGHSVQALCSLVSQFSQHLIKLVGSGKKGKGEKGFDFSSTQTVIQAAVEGALCGGWFHQARQLLCMAEVGPNSPLNASERISTLMHRCVAGINRWSIASLVCSGERSKLGSPGLGFLQKNKRTQKAAVQFMVDHLYHICGSQLKGTETAEGRRNSVLNLLGELDRNWPLNKRPADGGCGCQSETSGNISMFDKPFGIHEDRRACGDLDALAACVFHVCLGGTDLWILLLRRLKEPNSTWQVEPGHVGRYYALHGDRFVSGLELDALYGHTLKEK